MDLNILKELLILKTKVEINKNKLAKYVIVECNSIDEITEYDMNKIQFKINIFDNYNELLKHNFDLEYISIYEYNSNSIKVFTNKIDFDNFIKSEEIIKYYPSNHNMSVFKTFINTGKLKSRINNYDDLLINNYLQLIQEHEKEWKKHKYVIVYYDDEQLLLTELCEYKFTKINDLIPYSSFAYNDDHKINSKHIYKPIFNSLRIYNTEHAKFYIDNLFGYVYAENGYDLFMSKNNVMQNSTFKGFISVISENISYKFETLSELNSLIESLINKNN